MVQLRRVRRLTQMAFLLVLGVLITLVLWLPRRVGMIRDPGVLAIAGWWYRRLLGAMGAHVRVQGDIQHRAGMWISNHISWLDIVVIGSRAPVHFVSKSEVRQWPLIGFLAEQAGTLFIRRGANESGELTRIMQQRMQAGHAILFFPEGTTGHGDYLRRFHPRLFAAAIELGQPITPLAVRYEHDPQPHPGVPYTNGQNLLTNLWGLLGLKRLDITLIAPSAIALQEDQRRALADRSREVIRESLNLPAPALPPESVKTLRRGKH